MILFDTLHLDADDAITAQPEARHQQTCVNDPPSNNAMENRFNLVLLQRL